MGRRYRNLDPRVIDARFAGFCAETDQPIAKGEKCLYCPAERKVYKIDSQRYRDWQSAKEDEDVLGISYYKQI